MKEKILYYRNAVLPLMFVLLMAGCVQFTPEYVKGTDLERARLLYENGHLIEARELAMRIPKDDMLYRPAQRLIDDVNSISREVAREHMELGEDYERAGIIPAAIREYKISLKYNPNNLLVHRKLAFLAGGGSPEAASPGPRPAVEKKPADTAAKKSAKSVKKEVPRTSPEEFASEHYMRGKVYLESKAFHLAIKEFNSVLDVLPSFMDTETLLEEAVKGKDRMVDFHFKRGINFFQQEEISLAIREWDIVLALEPENKDAEDYKKRAETILERLQKIKERQADKASMLKSDYTR